jgi:hypothetical protein
MQKGKKKRIEYQLTKKKYMYRQNRNEICQTGGMERASTSMPDEPSYKIHHG